MSPMYVETFVYVLKCIVYNKVYLQKEIMAASLFYRNYILYIYIFN